MSLTLSSHLAQAEKYVSLMGQDTLSFSDLPYRLGAESRFGPSKIGATS